MGTAFAHCCTMLKTSALDCVLAARRSELRDLRALVGMVGLVGAVAEFVHQLQGERGLSSLHLARPDKANQQRLQAQRLRVDEAQARLGREVQGIDLDAPLSGGHGARLLSRLGVAVQAAQALPALRLQVQGGGFDVQQSTRAYSHLVAAWLALVFEVADVAGDADVSRQLVALFNLTHTKELVGQERALGSAMWASGQWSEEATHQIQDLIDSQQRGLSAFRHFASAHAQAQVDHLQGRAQRDERARLRLLLLQPTGAGDAQAASVGRAWFDACTAHMDQLKVLEDMLLSELKGMCGDKGLRLEAEVADLQKLCAAPQPLTPQQALMGLARGAEDPALLLDRRLEASTSRAPDASLGPELARHVMELVQEQAQRLQSVTAELEEARASLQERKVVERAKGLLMSQAGMGEDEAYQALRRRAMQSGQRLVDVAQGLLQRTN